MSHKIVFPASLAGVHSPLPGPPPLVHQQIHVCLLEPLPPTTPVHPALCHLRESPVVSPALASPQQPSFSQASC